MNIMEGNKRILTFNLLGESMSMEDVHRGLTFKLLNRVNSREWFGKEPGSCRVIDVHQAEPVPVGRTATMDHVEFWIAVGYRPKGRISGETDDGLRRLNGWTLEMRDQTPDGALLDGHGRPWPEEADPVYRPISACGSADFNDFDFGHFVGEE